MKFVTETLESPTGQVFMKTTCASDFKITISDVKGNAVRRTLPYSEYLSLLGKSEREETGWIRIPKNFIPGLEDSGYLDGYVTENGWSAVWRTRAAVRQLVHTSGHYRIPFPDLIFCVTVKNNIVMRDFVWVVDDKNRLYQYPFGNVSCSGDICMGNIKLNGVSIKEYEEEFFLGKTNNDYFHPGDHVKVKYSQDELLRRLDGKMKFPKRWLIPVRTTFKEVLKLADPKVGYRP